ncbi:MAG TPA: diphthine--ammonia ligase [Candidatus Nanoarchaeia archaeon]|nr:diphthine--ammonia ligase [Candidatus Nanoarchaeia archaeon]
MCGITGVFNHVNAFEQVRTALSILHNRGKDGVGISNFHEVQHHKDINKFYPLPGKCIVGHTLHAVVDDVPQPLKGKGVLVANCEIYNWQKLNKKYKFKAKNDAQLLLYFLDEFGMDKIQELDGVYAFAYWNKEDLYLVRDILGEKPSWFVHTSDGFAFASEKKVLEKLGYLDIQELNPRQILHYYIHGNRYETINRPFFEYLPEHKESYEKMKQTTAQLLDGAITKRIPERKFGLLFSGGVDSTYLAHYFKQQGYDFTCYTAVLDTDGTPPTDLLAAQKAAKELGLHLKIKKVKLAEIPTYLKKIVPLIEDSNVVKVGVALTFYIACEMAREDGCKVIFSGLGSEEIFAGYERHKQSGNINQECVSGLLKMYERDLYRDDVLTMNNNLELRLPYLDVELARYALKIPGKYKLKEETGKYILREIAAEKGIPPEFAFRKKTAAQYGSKFDYAIEKLAKKNKFPSKSAYLRTLYPSHNLRLGVLFSGGKDSTYSAYIMQRQNYELACLITMRSENKESFMFQSAGVEIVELQAQAMGLPLIVGQTKGEKEKELVDLEKTITIAKEKYRLDGIVSGALFSTYQRDRIEKICDRLGLKIFSPLWHKPQEEEMKELLASGFIFILSAVAAEGLDKSWLNKIITLKEVEKLIQINRNVGINVAGEGGEFESVVLDCPLFKKKIIIEEAEIREEGKYCAHIIIRKAGLGEK